MDKKNFWVEAFGHDERSTRFAKDGHCDSLVASDYKQPIIVAFAVENHPCDSRVTMTNEGIVQTLNARMGTGGGNVPLVLLGVDCYNLCDTGEVGRTLATNSGGLNEHIPVVVYPHHECYAIDSHPGDSRIGIAGNVSPTITVKIAKASSDGPLVLIKE